MQLQEMNRDQVLELVRSKDRVLAYEKMPPAIGGKFTEDGRKEIRLAEVDGRLTGTIFSPDVFTFDLDDFNGVFTIRVDDQSQG